MTMQIVIYAGSAEHVFPMADPWYRPAPVPPAGGARLPTASPGGRAKGIMERRIPGTVARVTAGLQARNERAVRGVTIAPLLLSFVTDSIPAMSPVVPPHHARRE